MTHLMCNYESFFNINNIKAINEQNTIKLRIKGKL